VTEKVAILGQGYVGLPLSVRAVDEGFDVLGFELDKRKVDALNNQQSYIDDITDQDVAKEAHVL